MSVKTVQMMKGGQVRLVPVGNVKKFIDRGFVEAVAKDGKLVAKGGAADLKGENTKLKARIKVLEAQIKAAK